ncbi:MAG TPA: ribosome small subunit-dependent GTPase A [Urbifossiella sp.]|jgi:ribosome biogenesis GTPase
MENKKKKVRVELRKNRSKPPRENDITRSYKEDAARAEDGHLSERVRAKGDISRYRTVIQEEARDGSAPSLGGEAIRGRVIRVHGLASVVEADDGRVFRCAIRRLLKSVATDERNAVTTGDIVWFLPADGGRGEGSGVSGGIRLGESKSTEEAILTPSPLPVTPPGEEGVIERVEPRRGVLTRSSRRREQVIVANVDQLVIVMSLAEPDLKPHLIDRYLAAAHKGDLKPILCLNKADLADPVALQPLIGGYSQMGIPTLLTSARTGTGIPRLRELLKNRATVFSGQSGVGKSSLLNAVQPELGLSVKTVSDVNQKGRHTTTYAQLIKLQFGGWVVDTPGVRQLALWDTRPEEVEGYFSDFRPFVPHCAFPDCTHTHESGCAVQEAVAKQQISSRRYHSYLGMFRGDEA